jgi:hypothetical protein
MAHPGWHGTRSRQRWRSRTAADRKTRLTMRISARSKQIRIAALAATLLLGACGDESVAEPAGEGELTSTVAKVLPKPPTDEDVKTNPDRAVISVGTLLLDMLQRQGDAPASAKIVVREDPKADFNNGAAARHRYESAVSTTQIFVSPIAFQGVRNRTLSLASVALLLCHEFGHYLVDGTEITKVGEGRNEGAADYFSISKCLLPALKEKIIRPDTLPQTLDAELTRGLKFRGIRELSAVERGVIASAKSLLETSKEPVAVSLEKTDRSESSTPQQSGHTATENQCRMDTYIAAVAGVHRPECWAPPKCSSISENNPSPFSYRVSADDKMVVRAADGRVVAELGATPKNGTSSVLDRQPVKLYFDARSGTGAGLFVYTKDGNAFLAHDGVAKNIPLTCRPEVLP